ncbi:MAG: hypothetical protein QXI24_00540 [Acidilobaceae archaeon]
MKLRRGQAEIIGGLIVLLVILIILIPLVLQLIATQGSLARRQIDIGSFQAERLAEKIIVSWLSPFDPRFPGFWANNTGTVSVTIRLIGIVDTKSNTLQFMVNLTDYTPGSGKPITAIIRYPGSILVEEEPLILNPGESALVLLNPDLIPNYMRVAPIMLSDRGVVHPVIGRSSLEDTVIKAITVMQRIVFLEDILNSEYFEPRFPDYFNNNYPQVGVSSYDGRNRYYYRLVDLDFIGKSLSFSNAIIGFKPGDKSKFNMLLTVFSDNKFYRVKIEGFQPAQDFEFRYTSRDRAIRVYATHSNLSDAIGMYYYGDIRLSKIDLKGSAESIKVFERTPSNSRISSYDPFVIVADTDGNGVGELIFSTEDYNYGSYNPPQVQCFVDEDGGKLGVFLDYSAIISSNQIIRDTEWGFAFKLRNVKLDPKIYAGMQVFLRIYFHDSEGGDFFCTDEVQLPLLRVMAIREDWSIVDSKDVLYFELASLEDTWPPKKGYTSISLALFIPPGETREVYLAIAIIDPYYGVGRNDLDFTIAIEILGITVYSR